MEEVNIVSECYSFNVST